MAEALLLRVAAREQLTDDVVRFVFRDPLGRGLPGYSAGAHITVTTPAGHRRSYSLAEAGHTAPLEYVVAVRHDPRGRGGSMSMHSEVHVGDEVEVDAPLNHFAIEPAQRYLLIAGGIGITPIRAMARQLRAQAEAQVEVLYLTRHARDTPFLEEFTTEGTLLHHSAVHGRLALWPWFAVPDDQTRIYCCGPTALVDEVLALTVHWRPSRVHVEHFAGVDAVGETASPFTATWAPTGSQVEVPADKSLLFALRSAGVPVRASCESGTCGTCRLTLLDGEADHRDVVLTDAERQQFVMPCVSRALSQSLTLAPPQETS